MRVFIEGGNLALLVDGPILSCPPAFAGELGQEGKRRMSLAEKHCVPCRGGVPPLKGAELEKFKSQVSGWEVINEHHLAKKYTFADFQKALDFVNRVGAIAEQEGHHPDLYLSWGKVGVETWTHKIDGLTESDFILAAKIDELPGV
jgi:4a-hydroxytetrahydrobiopterin dehydratase